MTTGGTATTPLHHTLSVAETCDLELVAAHVLPSGTVLGDPVRMVAPATGATSAGLVGLRLPGPLHAQLGSGHDQVDAGRDLVLHDLEQTPLAVLRGTEALPDGLVRGRLEHGRARESGVLDHLHLDLTAAPTGRDVLLLTRPPTSADLPHLARWREGAAEDPLVLVGEGHEGHGQPPPLVQVRVAGWLAGRLGLPEALVRVVPLRGRDAATDQHLATALVGHLAPRTLLVVSPTEPGPGAVEWAVAARELRAGGTGPLPGLHEDVTDLLRRWLPPRRERGLVVLLTGLSGSGKSTLARDLHRHLQLRTERRSTLLDGDVVRRLLSSGLGFDLASRETNVRRIGWVAARVAEHGGTAVCAPIAPFDRTRREVRAMAEQVADLVLVHVSTPLAECERRDRKGLYARARSGEVEDFTGISSPYEAPRDADLVLDTSTLTREEALRRLVGLLVTRGHLAPEEGVPPGDDGGAGPDGAPAPARSPS